MSRRDTIIIGGGPAGLTAGLYAARALMDVLLIRAGTPVCQAMTAEAIENYPGFPEGIEGPELVKRMEDQARRFGLEILEDCVVSVDASDSGFVVAASKGSYESRTVLIATGAAPHSLGVRGEREFRGRGVSYCATCDGAFFTDAVVAVVGGGDAALKEAVYLTRFASKVYLIHRRKSFRAEALLVRSAAENAKIEFITDHVIEQINGADLVQAVTIRNVIIEEKRELKVEGVFVFTGIRPNSELIEHLIETDERGFVVTNQEMMTSQPGIYAAGDVCQKHLRQIVTAVSDGAVAIDSIERFLSKREIHGQLSTAASSS